MRRYSFINTASNSRYLFKPTNWSATRFCSTKSSSTKNEKFTPFDLLALLFCMSMRGASMAAPFGVATGFLCMPIAFIENYDKTVSGGIADALAAWFLMVSIGITIGAAPITLPAYTAYKAIEYAGPKVQDTYNARKNRF